MLTKTLDQHATELPRFQKQDDFITPEHMKALQDYFQANVRWMYGWQSNKDNTPFSHWNHDFLQTKRENQDNHEQILINHEQHGPIRDLWLQLKQDKLKDHSLVRCYANAHTFGVEGYPHVDSRSPGNYTTICYINPIWKQEWAGETVFFNDLGDIAHAVLPKPGRITVFDGRIRHAARALSRICPAMRVTLMFKTVAPGASSDV
jgi:Rps23 Pro-64 3,4-dihydroxylase Tpa1-like proline 4-hydroxylase